jgi:hypothetical protein
MRLIRSVVILALTTTACGESSVGPTPGTRVEALVQDPAGTGTVTGTLAGNFFASLWNGDRWVDVGSPNGITIPLQLSGRLTTVHGEASVAAASYNRVRLVLQGVTARISRPSTIGGTTLFEDVTIRLGGSDERAELVVSMSSFSVEPDSAVRRVVVFDLGSRQWLTASAVQAGRVDDDALQAAVSASTRIEIR